MVRKSRSGLFDSMYADHGYSPNVEARTRSRARDQPQASHNTSFESSFQSLNVDTSMLPPSESTLSKDGISSQSTQHPAPRSAFRPEKYTRPYLDFMTDNPTIFHAVDTFAKDLETNGFEHLSSRDSWSKKVKAGGKYYTTRNGSAIIAFKVGKNYKPGNGMAIVAGHVDALTIKLKPIPKLSNSAGYLQLAVSPYAGGLNPTWWDRDLSLGGKVLIKDSKTGKIETKLVKLDWPIARIPTLAPHFGAAAAGPYNLETQAVPIVGIDNSDLFGDSPDKNLPKAEAGTFAATQPERLVHVIASELNVSDYGSIVNWELELFDVQPAQLGGLNKEFIFAGRIDDKLCCFSAMQALLETTDEDSSGIVKMVGCFDNEEIGSYLRQGARSNFMENAIQRICEATAEGVDQTSGADLYGQCMANSFLVSSDVIHAVNPNFLGAYLKEHSPRLNIGPAISADPNGHMTTDAVSTALMKCVADKCGSTLQLFQIRNDTRSGGTIGPMTSSRLGLRSIDLGSPQLSMHSIRATTGSLDPGLGVKLYKGFFDYYEEVDHDFR